MDKRKTEQIVTWGLFSLVIVALYGTIMRYKIAFDFPFFQQKNLLHAHSHYAFVSWISHFIYAGLAAIICPFLPDKKKRKYWLLVVANMLCGVGMLVTFTIQGYKAFSIGFSTFSIVQSIVFAWHFIKDSKWLPSEHPSRSWATAGLLLNVLSAIGPLYLGYMMATHHINQNVYLASIYYYLHFQYSGWFFFGCMAIVVNHLPIGTGSLKKYSRLFVITAVPTFFLSILWAKLPMWLYILTVIASLLQTGVWVVMVARILPVLRERIQEKHAGKGIYLTLFYASAFAMSLKFILQAVSAIPSLSQMVFGFRPVVIAYLHLVLLGVYSLFIIGYWVKYQQITPSKVTRTAIFAFLAGVFFNELFLGLQGIGAFCSFAIPHIPELLFAAALLLFTSSLALAIGHVVRRRTGSGDSNNY